MKMFEVCVGVGCQTECREVQVAGVGAVGRVNDQQAAWCVNFSAYPDPPSYFLILYR